MASDSLNDPACPVELRPVKPEPAMTKGRGSTDPAAIPGTPEAFRGETFARVRDGDLIRLDVKTGLSSVGEGATSLFTYGQEKCRVPPGAGGIMDVRRQWQIQPEEVLGQGPVVPVMVIRKLEQAVPLARALMAGGIRVLEITLRTPVAMGAIRSISREVSGAMVGAGTVTRAEELAVVAEAGAVFAISPGLTPELLDAANHGPIPLIPGIATISELMTGISRGYSRFKFFPAEAAGGVKMLRAIAGPFPQIRFCPTGGITPGNYRDYLVLNNVACVGGSWVAPQEAVDQGDWPRITALAREAVETAGRLPDR